MNCPYSGCLLKCTSKAVHRGKYAGIAMRWKKRVLQLGEEVKTTVEPKSTLIDYEKLRELRILWPLDKN